jgi:energy-coupling factor transporter transmembrane protein EcfT
MKFKKTYLLYILCLVVLLFNNYELTFVVWSFTALITLRTNFSKHFIYIISCFIAILLISFLTELFFYDEAKQEEPEEEVPF